MPHSMISAPGYISSLSSVTTGTGTAVATNDFAQISWYIVGTGTCTGGTVVIETAPTSTYAGTWSQLDSVALATTPLTDKAYYGTYPGNALFVRGRVSSNITGGGTISVYICGLQGS